MQVIYSGGSSTPSPSPRLPRKKLGYGQPFMPGYLPGQSVPTSAHNTVAHHHHGHPRNGTPCYEGDASLRDSIPAMSKPVAITCFVCNVLLPGLGTFISGLTVLCCSQIRHKGATKQSIVRVNSWVALLQFLTAFLFLLGWIWSVMWGAAFLSISGEYYKPPDGKKDEKSGTRHSSTSTSGRNQTSGGHSHVKKSHSDGSAHRNLTTTHAQSRISHSQPETHSQPMIVLQEPPVAVQPVNAQEQTRPILSHINPRQQVILCRRMSETEFSPFQLTNQHLEDIIIHDTVPIPNGTSASDTADGREDRTKTGDGTRT